MKISFGRLFRKLGLPFWTLLGVGLSGVFVNYIGTALETFVRDWLLDVGASERLANELPPVLVLLLVIATVIALASWQGRRVVPVSKRFQPGGRSQPEGKRGLIILVSNSEHALHAVRYHYEALGTLSYVWLIPSNDLDAERFGKGSGETAAIIRDRCNQLRDEVAKASETERPLDTFVMEQGASPGDAQDTYDLVNRIYRVDADRLGLKASEIIADFTGGTKPMSVGMIMACLPTERSLEYVAFNSAKKSMSGPFLIDYQHSAFDLIG